MQLNEYITLGRSGLRVSPLCLGAMTFGTVWGWGAEEGVSRALFDRYIEEGGNFIDTADQYTGGKSEEMVGKFMADRGLRDRIVLATKFTFNAEQGNPNAGGNGRKNIYRALHGSLQRLRTDFIDLYWLHAWDTITPVEEVLSTLNDLVREGKIRHYGFSDTPAWYVARAQTLAEKEGKERLIALQLEYSLVERNIEREHIPAAQELGLGICPWSPLASGFLSGKYKRQGTHGGGDGRLEKTKDWVATQPGVTSTILGASKLHQLEDNLRSLEFTIPTELRRQLDDVSAPATIHPYVFYESFLQGMIHGAKVKAWSPDRTRTTEPDSGQKETLKTEKIA